MERMPSPIDHVRRSWIKYMAEYMLQTESVIKQYKQYDTVITAVNRVSIKVEPGEFVAIIGTSGSGKSTFLHICAGLDSADAGRVLIRGEDITKMKPDELSRFRGMNMGFIFQRHNLIPQFTALENILIPTMMCNKSELSYQETLVVWSKPYSSPNDSTICRRNCPVVSSSVSQSPVR